VRLSTTSRAPRRSLGFAALIALAGAVSIDVAVAQAQALEEPASVTESPAVAGDPREAELDAMTAQIGATLRCPVCRQQSVAESTARISREMQGLIRGMLVDGKTPEEIEAYFVESYGPWILLRPKVEGANLFVYFGPLAAFLVSGLLIFARFRRSQRRLREMPDAPDATLTHEKNHRAEADHVGTADRAWLDTALRGS